MSAAQGVPVRKVLQAHDAGQPLRLSWEDDICRTYPVSCSKKQGTIALADGLGSRLPAHPYAAMRLLRNFVAPDSLQCCPAALQVAALTVGQEHNRHFDQMYRVWVNMLVGIIPQNTDIGRAYEGATSAEDQDFVQNLALFLTAFFKVGASFAARHRHTFHPSDQGHVQSMSEATNRNTNAGCLAFGRLTHAGNFRRHGVH